MKSLMNLFLKFGMTSEGNKGQMLFAYKKDHHEQILNDDAVYESVQDFFVNYIYTILKGTLTPPKN